MRLRIVAAFDRQRCQPVEPFDWGTHPLPLRTWTRFQMLTCQLRCLLLPSFSGRVQSLVENRRAWSGRPEEQL